MIKDLKDIELFQFKDVELNNKKNKIKKIIISIIATVLYSITLITSTFELTGYFKVNNNICNCTK
jgi:hypothetical protein